MANLVESLSDSRMKMIGCKETWLSCAKHDESEITFGVDFSISLLWTLAVIFHKEKARRK